MPNNSSSNNRYEMPRNGRPSQNSRAYVQGSLMPTLDGPSRYPEALPAARNDSATFALFLRSSHDQRMASRQINIANLTPPDRQEQETWAQQQLQSGAGNCIAGYAWVRNENSSGLRGYECRGGQYFVTDDLLAEGQGRYYISLQRHFRLWTGPGIKDLTLGRRSG